MKLQAGTHTLRKHIRSTLLCLILVSGIFAGALSGLALSAKAAVPPAGENPVVFFNAEQADTTFGTNDVYYHDITSELRLVSSTDARIDPALSMLQIDYDAVSASGGGLAPDGTYTIWETGGNWEGGRNASAITFRLMSTDPNAASYLTVSFYLDGQRQFDYALDRWMIDNGYSPVIPGDIVGEYTLNIPAGVDPANMQAVRFTFDRADASGTLWVGRISYDTGAVFEDFLMSSRNDRTQNRTTDPDGYLPFLRTPETIDAPAWIAGYNFARHHLHSTSTSDANIVNNARSGGKAMQISYQRTPNHDTTARLQSSVTYSDETLMALTIKGRDLRSSLLSHLGSYQDLVVDEVLNVALYNGNVKVAAIPFTDFVLPANLEDGVHTNMAEDEYQTYYYDLGVLGGGVTFNTVSFEMDRSQYSAGRIYVKDIYFPRFSYIVNHYYDNVIQDGNGSTLNLTDVHSYTARYKDKMNYMLKETAEHRFVSSSPALDASSVGINNANNVIDVYYASVNRQPLILLIEEVNTTLADAAAGDRNGDYPQDAIDTLVHAVAVAEAIRDSADISQTDIDDAVNSLRSALDTFGAAQIVVDYTGLNGLIETARAARGAAIEGSGDGQYPASAIAALQAAIDTAQMTADDGHLSQQTVDEAYDALRSALDAFVPNSVDRKVLEDAIGEAGDTLSSADIGNQPDQYPQDAADKLQAAIGKAVRVLDDSDSSQEDIDQAAADLSAAIKVFKSSIISKENPTNPDPTTPDPDPTTPDPDPTTPDPDPTTPDPDPTTPDPDPVTPDPDPTTPDPKPTTTAPKPTTTAPKPTTTAPKPTTSAHKPTTTAPKPVTTESKPEAADPQSTAAVPAETPQTGDSSSMTIWLWLGGAVLSVFSMLAIILTKRRRHTKRNR